MLYILPVPMANLNLTPVEVAILRSASRRGDPDMEYSDLLQTLNGLCDSHTGGMFVAKKTLEEIQNFGLDRKNPRWQATLFSIFRRTLGDRLGRDQAASGPLLEHEKKQSGA